MKLLFLFIRITTINDRKKGGIIIRRLILKTVLISLSVFAVAFMFLLPQQGNANRPVVYHVPLEDTIEKGLAAFLKRAINEAAEDGAEAIIFEIDTPGGVVEAAGDIGKLINSSPVQTIAFINNEALSAGAFISLYMDKIYMVPSATMGSAAIITQDGNAADMKAQSAWHKAMEAAAEQGGRDPIYALAMADERVDLPELGAPKGSLLTLSASQALEVGYSDGTVSSFSELLKELGYENAEIRTMEETFAEKLARFITNPIVVPILLTIGSLGLVLELYSPGFGVPGFMGISSLLLFFYGHLVAGFAGYETLILFIVGVILIVLELFLPGGIAGTIGGVAIIASLFLAADNIIHMGISILIAISISILVSILMVKVFGRKVKIFRKIILTDSTTTEKGYVSNKNRTELLGLEGIALTPLRPAGTVVIDDERIDVVSEGAFIEKDKRVRIVKVEGARIVVREIS